MGLTAEYRFGPFEVRTGARELFKFGMKIKLRGQPYLILELLLSRAGEVVRREELREKLWPADTFVDFEHSLNTSVKKLRQLLCDSAEEPRYIETVPRLGYRFIAPVEVVRGGTEPPTIAHAVESILDTAPPSRLDPQPYPTASWRWRMLGISSAAVLLGVVFLIAVAKSPGAMRRLFGSSNATVNASETPRRFGSIAVLPLQSISNDPSRNTSAME